MPRRRKLRAEEVLEHQLNDPNPELSTSSSESKSEASEASDEAGDLPTCPEIMFTVLPYPCPANPCLHNFCTGCQVAN